MPAADASGVVADVLQLLEQGAGLFVEKAPGFGQAQGAFTHDQQRAQLIFQLADLPAQGRLGHVQQFGGAGEVERLGQHLEVTQVTQFHQTSRVWWEIHSILDVNQVLAQCLAQQVTVLLGSQSATRLYGTLKQ
ncbi:hypothetical protein D3C71_1574890 [compost metagenome]